MKLIDKYIDENCNDESEREILQFGFERISVLIIGLISIIVVAILFHEFWRTLFFIICLLPLRQNAGGYHMKNELSCAISSVLILTVSILIIKHWQLNNTISVLAIMICSSIIFILAPVGNINHQLDEAEKHVYGYRARMICALEGLIFIVLMVINQPSMSVVIILSELITALLILLGAIQERSFRK